MSQLHHIEMEMRKGGSADDLDRDSFGRRPLLRVDGRVFSLGFQADAVVRVETLPCGPEAYGKKAAVRGEEGPPLGDRRTGIAGTTGRFEKERGLRAFFRER